VPAEPLAHREHLARAQQFIALLAKRELHAPPSRGGAAGVHAVRAAW
jgi:hypothetical protein